MISVHHIDSRSGGPDAIRGYRDALATALELTGRYAVETDPEALKQLREALAQLHLRLLSANIESANTALPPQLASDLRGILRNYRDQAATYIEHLRAEIRSTSEALGELLSSMESGPSDRQPTLDQEIEHLRSLAAARTIEELRTGVQRSTQALVEYADRVRHEKDAVVAQLKNEIQALHRSLEDAQQTAKLDPVTGMVLKQEFVRLLRRRIVAGESVAIACVWFRNFREMAYQSTAAAVTEVLSAFSRRLHNVIPGNARAGEWDHNTFCVVSPANGISSAMARIERSCCGRYVYMHGSVSRTFNLEIAVSHFDLEPGEDADTFISRIERAITARATDSEA